MSNLDRLVRIILGFGMIVGGIVLEGNKGCIIAWVGLVPLLTGLIGTCPLYSFFGFNTKTCAR